MSPAARVERLKADFRELYGRDPQIFSAPGRVNLIGEHTDYNDGFVLPMAIDRRTYVAGAVNGTAQVRVKSLAVGEARAFELDEPGTKRRGTWLDYVEGTARELRARGLPVRGCDLLIESDVPLGAGVSASAALELSVGLALAVLGGTPEPDRTELARAGQSAEHRYVGTLCGIMDQYIAAFAEPETALLLDCRSLETQALPLKLDGVSVLICDTRVRHELASSEYNLRHAECERAVAILKGPLPAVQALRDVSVQDLERWGSLLPPLEYRRCRHVVTENARTLAAARALRTGDLDELGRLMGESHGSLRDDYQVSCAELDVAVEIAAAEPAVYGARMTGGGFGGCSIALVRDEAIERVSVALRKAFAARGWREPELLCSRACAGVRRD